MFVTLSRILVGGGLWMAVTADPGRGPVVLDFRAFRSEPCPQPDLVRNNTK
jgi:hypothetical protein